MKRLILFLLVIAATGAVKSQELEGFKGQNRKYGFKNAIGEIVVAPKYDYYESFADGMAVVNIGSEWTDDPGMPWPEGGKWGYINEKGEEIVPLKYDATRTFSEGLGIFIVKAENGKLQYGFLNNRGKTVIPAEYSFANEFENKYAKVYNDEDFVSMVDRGGKLLFPFKYESVNHLFDDRFALGIKDPKGGKNDYLYALADADGKLLTEMKYTFMSGFEDGSINVVTGRGADNLIGFINSDGKEIIPVIYSNLDNYPIGEGYRHAERNGKWGLIDAAGKEVIPFIYERLVAYTNYKNKALVKKDSKWGMIDFKSKVLIPIEYENLSFINKDHTLLGVKIDGKWGLMDYNQKIIVEPQFDYLMDSNLKDNDKAVARVSLNKKYFHLDRNGNKVE